MGCLYIYRNILLQYAAINHIKAQNKESIIILCVLAAWVHFRMAVKVKQFTGISGKNETFHSDESNSQKNAFFSTKRDFKSHFKPGGKKKSEEKYLCDLISAYFFFLSLCQAARQSCPRPFPESSKTNQIVILCSGQHFWHAGCYF